MDSSGLFPRFNPLSRPFAVFSLSFFPVSRIPPCRSLLFSRFPCPRSPSYLRHAVCFFNTIPTSKAAPARAVFSSCFAFCQNISVVSHNAFRRPLSRKWLCNRHPFPLSVSPLLSFLLNTPLETPGCPFYETEPCQDRLCL